MLDARIRCPGFKDMPPDMAASSSRTRDPLTVWDLPTRLFHWVLVVLIILQYLSGELGLLSMTWHFRLGYATLALIVFRVLWGFAGSDTSRFSSFVRGPGRVVRYLRDSMRGRAKSAIGHNPLGGWSVLLMLLCIAVQTVSGLFSSDDVTETGPLAAHVSDATVELMTRIHHVGRWVLLVLIALHVVAVLMHWVVRDDNLVAPMLTGRKDADEPEALRIVSSWLALALAAASALAVWALVAWAG